MRRVSFTERISPQLKAVDVRSRLLHAGTENVTPFGPLERILRPILHDAVGWLNRFNPVSGTLSKRLAQAGRPRSTLDFRAEQMIWAAIGRVLGLVFTGIMASAGRFNAFLALAIVVGCAGSGFLLRDYALGPCESGVRTQDARSSPVWPSSWRWPSALARAPPARWSGSAVPPAGSWKESLPGFWRIPAPDNRC